MCTHRLNIVALGGVTLGLRSVNVGRGHVSVSRVSGEHGTRGRNSPRRGRSGAVSGGGGGRRRGRLRAGHVCQHPARTAGCVTPRRTPFRGRTRYEEPESEDSRLELWWALKPARGLVQTSFSDEHCAWGIRRGRVQSQFARPRRPTVRGRARCLVPPSTPCLFCHHSCPPLLKLIALQVCWKDIIHSGRWQQSCGGKEIVEAGALAQQTTASRHARLWTTHHHGARGVTLRVHVLQAGKRVQARFRHIGRWV